MKPYILALALAVSLSAGAAHAATGPASPIPAPDARASAGQPSSVGLTGPATAARPLFDTVRPHGGMVTDVRGGGGRVHRPFGWWVRAWAWAKGRHAGGPSHKAPVALATGLPALLLFGGVIGLAARARSER